MKQFEHLLRQAQSLLRSLDIHPLSFAAGVLFCIFFPRFFLLALAAYGVYWVATNIWSDPRFSSRKGRRKRRH